MNLSKILVFTLLIFSCNSWTQITVWSLNYINRIEFAHFYALDDQQIHSSVLPLITTKEDVRYQKEKGQIFTYNQGESKSNDLTDPKFGLKIYPIADIGIGGQYMKNNSNNPKYNGGIGLGIDFSSKKFFITGKLMPYGTFSGYVADSIQQNFNMDLGTTRPILGKIYSRNEFLIAYRPAKFFTFLGGYGKNFFGEGYRSLLLSDNASNYPFLKLETNFGSIKYVNLYTIWNDNSTNPANKSLDRMKFSSLHYLSWNITKEFNLSVFESVVWQAKDTISNRGFDANYLNPVVFYRPVEYSTGSADNVLLGLNLSYKINRYHNIYTQVVIDEFLLSKIKADTHWWGNKWGFQFGYKSNSFLAEDLYFQTEFNVVRPFTYSHKYSTQNYGHLNASVTHPLGANFYEVLNIISYEKNSMRFTNKITFSAYGADTDSINNGQNIFNSYSDRNGDYNHLIMQGLRTNVLNEQFSLEVPVLEKIELYFSVTYNYRMQYNEFQTTHNHFLMFGVRSRLWNVYGDF